MENRELTRAERSAIRKLATGICANYDNEYGCLPLDCPCYMLHKWWTGAYCKYFRNALLPLDPVLETAITDRTADKHCAICNKPVYTQGNRVKYCKACSATVRRKRQRDYMRKRRYDS
jgi:hypothetical protein